jgi:hypothetical protein
MGRSSISRWRSSRRVWSSVVLPKARANQRISSEISERGRETRPTNTKGPRICFRISGLIVVIGSLLLPVITTYETLWHKRLILAIVSLTVAVLSSLSTFYKWDYSSQTREKATLELKGLLAKWELNLIAAQVAKNPAEEALDAAKQLFDDSFKIVDTETGQFFANLSWPSISPTRPGE